MVTHTRVGWSAVAKEIADPLRLLCVKLASDEEYRGRSRRLDSDVANVGDSWNDRISSLRVF
jgi:hypothetical protein